MSVPDAHHYLSREKLYELVWAKPMQHLAKEYGISDRALTISTCDTGHSRWVESKSLFGNWLIAFDAKAIIAAFDAAQGVVNLAEKLLTATLSRQSHFLLLDRVDARNAPYGGLV